MLIRITNKCTMECNHCLTSSHPAGEDMTLPNFVRAMITAIDLEGNPTLLISGGEPTDHPEFISLMKMATSVVDPYLIILLTNGLFLKNEEKTKEILNLRVHVQVTCDKRFYPQDIPRIEHDKITYIDEITHVSPFGRAKLNPSILTKDRAPNCFNLRSVMYEMNDIRKSFIYLRMKGYMCTPSVNVDGSIVAGEAPECAQIGHIWTTIDDLGNNLNNINCQQCMQHTTITTAQVKKRWNAINHV